MSRIEREEAGGAELKGEFSEVLIFRFDLIGVGVKPGPGAEDGNHVCL